MRLAILDEKMMVEKLWITPDSARHENGYIIEETRINPIMRCRDPDRANTLHRTETSWKPDEQCSDQKYLDRRTEAYSRQEW